MAHDGPATARRALSGPPRIGGGGGFRGRVALLLLAVVVTMTPGCTSRFNQHDPDAATSSEAVTPLTPNGNGAIAREPALRVNLSGPTVPLSDEQVASLKRAWEAASGHPVEIAVSGADATADVVLVSSSTLADAVAAKQITPLTVAPNVNTAGDVPEAVRRALTWKGTVYALPLAARLRVLVYDPARLRAAGVDDRPAPTLEGLRAQWLAAAARSSAGAVPAPATSDAGTPPSANPGSLSDDVALLTAAFGGGLVDEEGALAVASKPAVRAVEFLKGLRERGLLPNPADNAPFAFADWDGSAADARPAVGLPPVLAAYDPAARPFVVVGEVFGVAVSTGARDRSLAERFARFVTDPLVSRGLLGPRALVTPESAGDETPFARLASHLTVPGGPFAHARSRTILDRYVRAALDGTLPVGEALAKAAAEIEGRPAAPPADTTPAAPPPVSDKPAAPAPGSSSPPPTATPPASSPATPAP